MHSDLVDERALIDAAVAGDQRAFAELLEGAQRRMWAVALSITGNRHDAEDAMQNALIAVWRNLHTFEPRARFSTWAYRIASNAALQIVRSRRDTPEADAGLVEVDKASPVGEQVPTSLVMRAALSSLAPEFREVLVLREYGGLDYREIAEQQQIPVATVKSRLHRARTRLRESLVDAGVSGY